jgi:hypothetical protein
MNATNDSIRAASANAALMEALVAFIVAAR